MAYALSNSWNTIYRWTRSICVWWGVIIFFVMFPSDFTYSDSRRRQTATKHTPNIRYLHTSSEQTCQINIVSNLNTIFFSSFVLHCLCWLAMFHFVVVSNAPKWSIKCWLFLMCGRWYGRKNIHSYWVKTTDSHFEISGSGFYFLFASFEPNFMIDLTWALYKAMHWTIFFSYILLSKSPNRHTIYYNTYIYIYSTTLYIFHLAVLQCWSVKFAHLLPLW